MADDINPKVRADVEAQRAFLAPIIRGDHDLSEVSISPDLKADILADVANVERRMSLLTAVISWLDGTVAAMQDLENDGYPALPPRQLPSALMAELTAQKADLEAAIARFVPQQAANISVTLGAPTEKPPAPKKGS